VQPSSTSRELSYSDAAQPVLSPAVVSPSSSITSPSLLSPTAERPPVSHSSAGPQSPRLQAIALFDFEGDTSLGDLVFTVGETIVDIQSVSAEWMSGRIGERTGRFPTAFVQIS